MFVIGVYYLDIEGILYFVNILIGCICIIFNSEKKCRKKLKICFNIFYLCMIVFGFKMRFLV